MWVRCPRNVSWTQPQPSWGWQPPENQCLRISAPTRDQEFFQKSLLHPEFKIAGSWTVNSWWIHTTQICLILLLITKLEYKYWNNFEMGPALPCHTYPLGRSPRILKIKHYSHCLLERVPSPAIGQWTFLYSHCQSRKPTNPAIWNSGDTQPFSYSILGFAKLPTQMVEEKQTWVRTVGNICHQLFQGPKNVLVQASLQVCPRMN